MQCIGICKRAQHSVEEPIKLALLCTWHQHMIHCKRAVTENKYVVMQLQGFATENGNAPLVATAEDDVHDDKPHPTIDVKVSPSNSQVSRTSKIYCDAGTSLFNS